MRATRRSDNAVVLFRGDSAFAWSGRLRIAVDSLSGPTGVAGTPFYLGLYATAGADTGGPGSQRAIATRLLYAVPPADAWRIQSRGTSPLAAASRASASCR